MSEPTEDIEYTVPEFATTEPDDKTDDVDQPNKPILKEVQKYLKDQINTHNSFDAIVPEAEGVMTTQQQVQMHKQVVVHLRNIKQQIDNKIKELK